MHGIQGVSESLKHILHKKKTKVKKDLFSKLFSDVLKKFENHTEITDTKHNSIKNNITKTKTRYIQTEKKHIFNTTSEVKPEHQGIDFPIETHFKKENQKAVKNTKTVSLNKELKHLNHFIEHELPIKHGTSSSHLNAELSALSRDKSHSTEVSFSQSKNLKNINPLSSSHSRESISQDFSVKISHTEKQTVLKENNKQIQKNINTEPVVHVPKEEKINRISTENTKKTEQRTVKTEREKDFHKTAIYTKTPEKQENSNIKPYKETYLENKVQIKPEYKKPLEEGFNLVIKTETPARQVQIEEHKEHLIIEKKPEKDKKEVLGKKATKNHLEQKVEKKPFKFTKETVDKVNKQIRENKPEKKDVQEKKDTENIHQELVFDVKPNQPKENVKQTKEHEKLETKIPEKHIDKNIFENNQKNPDNFSDTQSETTLEDKNYFHTKHEKENKENSFGKVFTLSVNFNDTSITAKLRNNTLSLSIILSNASFTNIPSLKTDIGNILKEAGFENYNLKIHTKEKKIYYSNNNREEKREINVRA